MPAVLALGELAALGVVLLCIALALLITYIMDNVGKAIRPVPVVGPPVANAIHALAQAIASALGAAERGVDAAIGASWHALAKAWDETWTLLKDAAHGYALLAALVARLVYAHSGLKSLVHVVKLAVHGIEHGVRTLERKWHGIESRVEHLEKDWTKGIGHDLRVGLQRVEKELHGVEHTVDKTLPKAIAGVKGEVTGLRDFLGVKPGTSYLDWVKALTLAGLAALGLKGLTCKNNPLRDKDCGWGGWDDLGGLLVGAAAFGAALNLADIVEAAVEVEQEALSAVEALVNIDGAAIHEAARVVAAAANAVAT